MRLRRGVLHDLKTWIPRSLQRQDQRSGAQGTRNNAGLTLLGPEINQRDNQVVTRYRSLDTVELETARIRNAKRLDLYR